LIAEIEIQTTTFKATDLNDPQLDNDGNGIVEQRIVLRSIMSNLRVF
jgi:hypothetical protein